MRRKGEGREPGKRGGGKKERQIGGDREERRKVRKRVVAVGGHYRSPAEGGTSWAGTAFDRAGAGRPGGARPRAGAPGCWAPPPGGCAALNSAVPRVLGSRAGSARGAGDPEVVRGREVGRPRRLRVPGRRAGPPTPHLPSPPQRAPHLGPAGLLPRGHGSGAPLGGPAPTPSRAGGGARPPRRAVAVSAAAAAGREGATGGCCRAASGGREPSARSRHLEPRLRAGLRVPGKGPGDWARGAREAGVRAAWERRPGAVMGNVREGVWPLGRGSRGLPPFGPPLNPGAVPTRRSSERSRHPRGSPSPWRGGELRRGGGVGTKTLLHAHTPAAHQKWFSHFPFLPPCPSHSRKQSPPYGVDFWTPPHHSRELFQPERGTDTDRIPSFGINAI